RAGGQEDVTLLGSAPAGAQDASFLSANREKIFYALAIAATVFLLPFSLNNFWQGRHLLGLVTGGVAACFIVNALAIYRGKLPPVPVVFICLPALAGLALSMSTQGLVGILWSYPAMLLFHFVLERRFANLFNACIVLVAGPFAYQQFGPALAGRVVATLTLTI